MRKPGPLFEIIRRTIDMHREVVRLAQSRPEKNQPPVKRLLHALIATAEQARQMAVWFAYVFAILVCGPVAWPEFPWPRLEMEDILKISLVVSFLRWGIFGGLYEYYENQLLKQKEHEE